ncbi:hypothetical protein NEIFL0001_1324 [Neisseria flavescens SK114]|nr:hypothetical protein NEIFL0001_1324 [Neisseria flavescens SK114]
MGILKRAEKRGKFQHTAARRRLAEDLDCLDLVDWFQHTAARRRLVSEREKSMIAELVSTHSRPKTAG